MITRLLIAVVLIAGALDGNAQNPPPGGPSKRCLASDPSCVVTVAVPVPCNSCTPTADPAYVGIEKGNKTQITWRLATPNYAFDRQKGIVFPGDPNGDEFKCRAEQNAAVFVCDNKHSTSGKTYKYTVNVTGAGAPKPLDPWIVNE